MAKPKPSNPTDAVDEYITQCSLKLAKLVKGIIDLPLSSQKKLFLVAVASNVQSCGFCAIDQTLIHLSIGLSEPKTKQILFSLIQDDYLIVKDQSGDDLLLEIVTKKAHKRFPTSNPTTPISSDEDTF